MFHINNAHTTHSKIKPHTVKAIVVFSDSIEITRRDSITLSQPLDTEDRILQDVTEKSIAAQHTDSGEVPGSQPEICIIII